MHGGRQCHGSGRNHQGCLSRFGRRRTAAAGRSPGRSATDGRSTTSSAIPRPARCGPEVAATGSGQGSGAPMMAARRGSLRKLTKGTMDEWAANDPDFAAMIGWTDTPPPFEDAVLASLVAALRPWHALCRHQAGQAPRQPGRRQDVGASRGAGQPSFRRQLESRRGRPRAAHHRFRSRGSGQDVDRHLGGGRLRHRGRRQDVGTAQSPLQRRSLRDTTTIPPRPATAKPAIASTT